MNIFHGLLFLSGHIADPKLALRLGGGERRSERDEPRRIVSRRRGSRLRWLLEELVLLGGRPMATHRNDDLEEPFPDLHPCG